MSKTPMLFLVQHGQAVKKDVDPQRPLSAEGQQAVERMAEWAASKGFSADRIWHSGKLRAKQTAAIFAGRISKVGDTEEKEGLSPKDDVKPVAAEVNKSDDALLIAGHMPFLSRLASALVCGNSDQTLIQFENSAWIGLKKDEEGWKICCIVPPGLIE